MTTALSRFYFGSDGELCKIVHPTSDAEVLDNRHDEPGKTGVNAQRASYNACVDDRAFFVFIQPIISQVKSLIGDLMTQKVALIDALQGLSDDRETYNNRVAQWPSPTGPQQLLINAALAHVAQDLQSIQTIRDNIAAIKEQLG